MSFSNVPQRFLKDSRGPSHLPSAPSAQSPHRRRCLLPPRLQPGCHAYHHLYRRHPVRPPPPPSHPPPHHPLPCRFTRATCVRQGIRVLHGTHITLSLTRHGSAATLLKHPDTLHAIAHKTDKLGRINQLCNQPGDAAAGGGGVAGRGGGLRTADGGRQAGRTGRAADGGRRGGSSGGGCQ